MNAKRALPSGRINLAVIGCGAMGMGNMDAFMKDARVQVVGVCEIGHRSITIAHLANSCIKTGVKSIRWDAARETSDNAAVNARADIRRYNGWELG